MIILKNKKLLYFFIIFLFSFLISKSVKAITIIQKESQNDKTCSEVCRQYELECQGITTSATTTNNSYCSVGDTPDTCEQYTGNCNTILYDEDFNGCDFGYSNCSNFPEKQASWTNCNCYQDYNKLLDLNYYDGSNSEYWYAQVPIVQTFSPNQTNITAITFKTNIYSCQRYNNYLPCQNIQFHLCKGNFATSTYNNWNGGIETSCETLIASTTQNIYCGDNTISFPQPLQLFQNSNYWWSINKSCSVSGAGSYLMSTVATQPKSYHSYNPYWSTGSTPLYFKTYYSQNFAYVNFVPFVSGVGGISSGGVYKDFDFWQAQFSYNPYIGSLTTNQYETTLQAHYGTSTSQFSYSDSSNITYLIGKNYPVNVSIAKTWPLNNGKYFAFLQLVDNETSEVIASSSIITFWIDNLNGSSTFVEFPTYSPLTYLDICKDVATSTGGLDDIRYGIECGFKKIVFWSFYPSQDSVKNLNGSFNNFKNEFPFSAYFGLIDTVKNSISTSTMTTNGTLKMPFINKTGDFITLNIMSSTSMPNLIGQTNTNLFRNSITWIIWLMVAFIIFIQFKKI